MRTMPYEVVPTSEELSLLGLMISLSSTGSKREYVTNYMIFILSTRSIAWHKGYPGGCLAIKENKGLNHLIF